MKLKEIKPGMVIKCDTEEEYRLLMEELERLGYTWVVTENKPTKSNHYPNATKISKNCYRNISFTDSSDYFTHNFSDIIIHEEEMSAEEAICWLMNGYMDERFSECFGNIYNGDLTAVLDNFSAVDIVKNIKQWKADNEKKEIEVEWVDMCRIIEVSVDGYKKVVHEEDINSGLLFGGDEECLCAEIFKKWMQEHDGNYIAVHERVCRVKGGE